ncbi:hypothetical protein [Reyranella soli]|nr:hypothetical protein [Reyranella soli]
MDVYASNWNEVDNNNNTPSPEGCVPSGVKNGARAIMGAHQASR